MDAVLRRPDERPRASFPAVLKGVIGCSFLATILFGFVASRIGLDPSPALGGLVTFGAGALGGLWSWRG